MADRRVFKLMWVEELPETKILNYAEVLVKTSEPKAVVTMCELSLSSLFVYGQVAERDGYVVSNHAPGGAFKLSS